ncbi:MAG: PAS domain-containing sensor histidine kinase [Thermodesulfobacteriota bacterium]
MNDNDLVAKENNRISHDLAFYRFIIDSLPVGVFTVNSELRITSFNPWAQKMTGYSAQEVTGRYCGEILRGGMCKADCPLKAVLDRERPMVQLETTIQDRYGNTIPVRKNIAGLLDATGKLIGGVEALQDISYIKTLERQKANFISMIAHDMKSSLAILGGFSLRLLNKAADIGKEEQHKYLGIITKELGKVESLVNDFLELSHLQSGELKLNFSATSLDRELLELFEAYQPKAAQRGIKLELANAEPLPIIEADANRLHRVFNNLLDNALKFSKEKGKITIVTQETDQDVIIKIIDRGVGINAKDLSYIFDPFHRGESTEKKEGFGLGLAIVKAIVEGHGGRVRVESELGKGSIFIVVLPRDRKSGDGKAQPEI